MRKLATVATLALFVLGAGAALAQVDVTVDPGTMTFGYMNVFNLGGGFEFGSGWGTADLTSMWAGSTVTLGPNTIGDPNEYWYQCTGTGVAPDCGSPGALGNKIMEAILHAQVDDGTLSGVTVNFSGEVLANSLTGAHTTVAFIRDFAPDFSSFVESTVVLGAPGTFSISLATIADPARHVQYGFVTTGENVWITDVAPFGTISIGPYSPVSTENDSWGNIKAIYR